MGDVTLAVPPHSREAEQSVLGALLQDNRAFDRIADKLQAEHFYRAEHRAIYATISRLVLSSKPADVLTVFDAMRGTAYAEDGGLPYLHELYSSVASATNVARYAEIVVHRALSRRLIEIGRDLESAGFEAGELHQAIDKAVGDMLALQQGQGDNNPVELASLLPAWIDDLTAREQGHTDAIPTGLHQCDELFAGGARRGELIVIGSRPSMGKTGLCHTLARNFAREVPVLVLSQEDSLQMLVTRQVAAAGKVNLADLRNPARARVAMWEGVTKGLEVLNDLPIHVDDQPSLSLREVQRKANYVRSRRGDLGVIIIDYLQLMEEPGEEKRAYELNKISRGLKRMAKQMKCVVVLLSQLSREADKMEGSPRLDHLAESGGIEQAADIIGLMWRESRRRPTPPEQARGAD